MLIKLFLLQLTLIHHIQHIQIIHYLLQVIIQKEKISNIDPLIPYLVKCVNNQIYLNPNQKYYVDDFNYKSNDESIIEINNNIVIPKNIGKTSIIISNSNINKEIEVEVHSPLEDFEYNLSNTLNVQLNNKLSSIIEFNNNVAYYIENWQI